MSDPDDKKIRIPVRTSAPKKAIAPPARPASLPLQTSAKMPVRLASTQPVHARGPSRPVMQPSTTNRPVVVPPPSRRERLMSGVDPMPVPNPKDARVYTSSSPTTGRLELGLADLKVQSDREFAAEKRRKWLLSYETAQNVRVTGCRAGTFDEPRYFDLMVGFKGSVPVARSNEEFMELREQRGFRHARETVALADERGNCRVAHCESDGALTDSVVQTEAEVSIFQSPDIPAWKSRVVSTDDSNAGGSRVANDSGLETLEAICAAIFEVDLQRANMLADSRWKAFALEHAGDPRTPEELSLALITEVIAEKSAVVRVCRSVVETIGPASFAGLWNSAIESCTFVASPASEAKEPVLATDDYTTA